jgi:hypothetical protein
VRHATQLLSAIRQNGVFGCVVWQCVSLVQSSQLPAMQTVCVPVQCASDPHSAQTIVVGLQWGVCPPQSASVMHVGSHSLSMQACPAGQWLLSAHSSQAYRGRPAALGVVSQRGLFGSTAQSASVMQSTHRLFGASQMLLPVGVAVQVAVPHCVTQELLTQVWPAAQCAVSVHCSHA